ncbi:MAG TPA: allantoate amidohydrolase [Casimicrobiaceae bacterium]|jgi:hydantoinase/carbamoylase family amidase
MRFGNDILRQADALAAYTEDPPRLTRTYLTAQHRQAGNYLLGLMREAGMEASYDALGNVVGRYRAQDPAAPIVMSGSHMDSVRDAGRYDGLFGILTAIACVRDLSARGKRLPYTYEVVAFGDEEGVRFGVTLSGSKAMGGSFDPSWLDAKDADGTTLRDALSAFGGDPDGWRALDRRDGRVVAYVESHIEQGPVLLNEGLPVGIVTAIAGGSRMRVSVTGLAGHAGTVPMGARRDALAAAAEMALAVERIASQPGKGGSVLVGTVGVMKVRPGAINVIPQDVDFTVDVRSADDGARHAAVAEIRAAFDAIAARRHVKVVTDVFYELDAAPCDPALQDALAASIGRQRVPVRRLPSGAGHDAMVFPPVCPIAMLFVRCGAGGISHHPSETMTAEDAEIATAVLLDFLEHYAPPKR